MNKMEASVRWNHKPSLTGQTLPCESLARETTTSLFLLHIFHSPFIYSFFFSSPNINCERGLCVCVGGGGEGGE